MLQHTVDKTIFGLSLLLHHPMVVLMITLLLFLIWPETLYSVLARAVVTIKQDLPQVAVYTMPGILEKLQEMLP